MFRLQPAIVLLGGDLFPSAWAPAATDDFIRDTLAGGLRDVRAKLGDRYPPVLMILGNDDARAEEELLLDEEFSALWHYLHGRPLELLGHQFFGYAYIPPTPFQFKDWEKYDVGQYVAPGCVSPEEGRRSVEVDAHEIRYGTIAADLEVLARDADLDRAIFLFHGPPYETKLDRAALDGKSIDHVPLDLHVGSIAVRRFIDAKQPKLTLHGHIHESARLTGSWHQQLGRTHLFGGAHDGPELALVRFDLDDPRRARRELL